MPAKKHVVNESAQQAMGAEEQIPVDAEAPNLGKYLGAAQDEDAQNYMDPDLVAEHAEQETEDAEAAGIGAEMSASFIVMLAENTALSIWPFLEYDTHTRDRTVELLIPVIEKHGGELPPWLAAYKEELMLGGHIALVILMTRRQIRQEDARIEEENRKANLRKHGLQEVDEEQEKAAA